MRSVRACLLMLMLVPGSLLSAQTSPEKHLVQAFALEREGKLTQATAAIQTLLDAKSLNAPDTAKHGTFWRSLMRTRKALPSRSMPMSNQFIYSSDHLTTSKISPWLWTVLEDSISRWETRRPQPR